MWRKKHISDPKVFIEHLQQLPLSLISYILWYQYKKQEDTQFAFRLNPFEYIHRFENKYTLYGKNVWTLKTKVRWFKTNLVLMFTQEDLWKDIVNRFSNFRDLETNKTSEIYNTYIIFKLDIQAFNFNFSSDENIIELPTPSKPLPKRYRSLSGGLSFAYVKNENIVSFAAAPHILSNQNFSFAILRGIETKLTERKQGYALQIVSVLCKELFSRYHLSNLFLWVEEKNIEAISLYKKIGFVPEGKILATYCDLK